MKKLFKFILILNVILLLSACNNKPNEEIKAAWKIESNVNQTYIYEEVFIGSNHNIDVDWYLKVNDSEFELYQSQKSNVYFKTAVVGTYTFKAVNNDVESNLVTIKYEDLFGDVFGHSPLMERPTRGIDYSKDKGNSKELVHEFQNRTADLYTYFKDIYSTRYIISADIDILSVNGQEPYPKAGLLAAQLNDRKILFAFDARANFDNDDVIVVNHTATHGGTWDWPGTIYRLRDINFRTSTGSHMTYKLTVIREDTMFYFFLDGSLIIQQDFPDLDQETVAGTYTMGQSVKYTNYYAYQDDPNDENDAYSLAVKTMLNR
ncbi:hypothetical protein [Acholeplasma granularum]|uniref:hypothetical protein n=1 Tax=Acholeplasma granularum TaxID=264635 RepID=UPI000472945A|nr:hypothetical protein [Acholeplasma granularum]